jgi:hypothetical protein
MLGPEALPPSCHRAELGGPRQPMAARKPDAIRRLRRTCSVVGPSAACDPSCGAGSALRAPSAWPCASEIRASGCGACCGGDMSACPWELHEIEKRDRKKRRQTGKPKRARHRGQREPHGQPPGMGRAAALPERSARAPHRSPAAADRTPPTLPPVPPGRKTPPHDRPPEPRAPGTPLTIRSHASRAIPSSLV